MSFAWHGSIIQQILYKYVRNVRVCIMLLYYTRNQPLDTQINVSKYRNLISVRIIIIQSICNNIESIEVT